MKSCILQVLFSAQNLDKIIFIDVLLIWIVHFPSIPQYSYCFAHVLSSFPPDLFPLPHILSLFAPVILPVNLLLSFARSCYNFSYLYSYYLFSFLFLHFHNSFQLLFLLSPSLLIRQSLTLSILCQQRCLFFFVRYRKIF